MAATMVLTTGVVYVRSISGTLSFSTTGALDFGGDTFLVRDAANTLAQRNSTAAQSFRVYNTFTDASNYERMAATWSANTAYVRSESAGTGTARAFEIGTDGLVYMGFRTNGALRWYVDGAGHFVANADNTYDVGNASGAVRDLYVDGRQYWGGVAFGSLGTPANGTLIYCTDCTIANPCAGAGNGAFAKRLNGVWVCN